MLEAKTGIVDRHEPTPTSFPLKLWQNSDQYAREYEAANVNYTDTLSRLRENGFRCTYIGLDRFDEDGYPEVWINDNMPLGASRWKLPVDRALNMALQHGDTGWWTLDILSSFSEGSGPIMESAMWSLGFRKSKVRQDTWARVKASEKAPNFRGVSQPKTDAVIGEDAERLRALRVLENSPLKISETYDLTVGARGMIHIRLNYNPFEGHRAEAMGILFQHMRQRGHINPYQDGFCLVPRNVLVGGIKYIHIIAIQTNGRLVETVWPTRTTPEGLFQIARNLATQIRSKEAEIPMSK